LTLRSEITKDIQKADYIEDTNIDRLAKIYSAMSIKDVVVLMKSSKDELVARILIHMTEGQVAKILTQYASFDSERAARLMELIRSYG